jgi:hypothetical protein
MFKKSKYCANENSAKDKHANKKDYILPIDDHP